MRFLFSSPSMKATNNLTSHFFLQWLQAEARCAELEPAIRELVSNETAEQLQEIHKMYMEKLAKENDINEERMEQKLDILSQATVISPESGSRKERIQEVRN